MDANTPCRCPKCGWLGTLHDLASLAPLDICPRCTPETKVQPLGQKGLDALRHEYALLLKPGYTGRGDRDERRAQIERFFEHIGQRLRGVRQSWQEQRCPRRSDAADTLPAALVKNP